MQSPDAIRVLVADDDESVRTVLAHVLADYGFDVVAVAADGVEAVALTESLQPDAVVLDVRMPRVGGIEAARRISPLRAGLRVIMLSAYDDPALQQEAAAAGASRFLVKGCSLSDLVDAVGG